LLRERPLDVRYFEPQNRESGQRASQEPGGDGWRFRERSMINSLIIPGEDDGKVSVESAKLQGMRDFVVLPVSHPFLMKDDEAIQQTILRNGNFANDGSGP
jgi:hypothetical protein